MANRFLITGGGSVVWDASDTSIWSATSGGSTGASVPVDGDDVIMDANSGGGTVTLGYNPTVTSITGGAFTGTFDASTFSPTMDTFNFSGTGTRTLNMGSGTWTIRGNNTTIFTCTTVTNLTLNYETSTVDCTYSGSVGTRTINLGTATSDTSGHLFNLKISAGSDTVNLTGSGSVNIRGDLDFTGFTGTAQTGTSNWYGNVTWAIGMTWTSGASTISFRATSGTQIITSNGIQINQPITFNGVGGTFQLADSLNMSGAADRTLTLTNGTFNANNFNVTCGIFSSSNSNTRTLTMGSGTWTLTGNNATIWTTATQTNLTVTGSPTINCTYSGSTGTRTITPGTILNTANTTATTTFNITSGADIINFGSSTTGFHNLGFAGFTGTFNPATATTIQLSGNLVLGTGMTNSYTGVFQFNSASGTQTVTSNGVSFGGQITKSGVGSTLSLSDNLVSTAVINLTSGGLDLNDFNITSTTLSSSNSNIRTLTMGSGTWTLTGTGTVWNTGTVTNLTLNPDSSTIVINDASASSKTFSSGVATFNNLLLSGAGTGAFIIGAQTATNTFNDFSVDTPPHTVRIFAGKTIVANSINWSGEIGNRNTFESTSAGTAWTINVPSGVVSQNWISLQDSTASGSVPFYAGVNSIDVSGNTNWIFENTPGSNPVASRDENHVHTLLATTEDGQTVIPIVADPTTHALGVDDDTTGSDNGPENAPRDANHVTAIMAVSADDGVTPVILYADRDGKLLIDSN